jgi:hypothetical protein
MPRVLNGENKTRENTSSVDVIAVVEMLSLQLTPFGKFIVLICLLALTLLTLRFAMGHVQWF